MRRIDTHGHIIVQEITSDAGGEPWRPRLERAEGGIFFTANGQRNGPMPRESTDLAGMLRDMDALRIDTMLICPPPFLFLYDLPVEENVKAARIQNDAMALAAERYPDRFAPLATVPLQDADAAVAELRRATRELGFRGVEIGSNVGGVHLGDARFRPFWRACAEDDLFVFIHPDYFQSHGSTTLQHYYLVNLFGNPAETGLTAAHMVFSGLFDELPDLKVMLAHAGGVMPWLFGRWSHGYHHRPEPKRQLRSDPRSSAKKFYVDTITHGQSLLAFMIETFGVDHVLLGSDYPFDMGPDDPVGEVEALDTLSDADKEAILGGTIARLMRLDYS